MSEKNRLQERRAEKLIVKFGTQKLNNIGFVSNVSRGGLGIKAHGSFPKGTVLPEGGILRIYTACGEAAPDRLFWCRKGAGVWNNGGDTAFLLDPSGNLVDERPTN